jgi:hypothetical protein
MLRAARPLQSLQLGHGEVEDAPVEEQDCTEYLVLGGGGDPAFDREVIEEGRDPGGGELAWMAAVETDKCTAPEEICFLRAGGVVQAAEGTPRGVDEGHAEGPRASGLVGVPRRYRRERGGSCVASEERWHRDCARSPLSKMGIDTRCRSPVIREYGRR